MIQSQVQLGNARSKTTDLCLSNSTVTRDSPYALLPCSYEVAESSLLDTEGLLVSTCRSKSPDSTISRKVQSPQAPTKGLPMKTHGSLRRARRRDDRVHRVLAYGSPHCYARKSRKEYLISGLIYCGSTGWTSISLLEGAQ
jgi:hypothetical protein